MVFSKQRNGKINIHSYDTHMESISARENLQVTGSSLAWANYVQGQGSTWMRLDWRSMSGDTSGACCQGKLSYPAMSTPPPPNTHTCTAHIHSDFQPFLRPQGTRKDRRKGMMMRLLTEKCIYTLREQHDQFVHILIFRCDISTDWGRS